MAEIVRITDVAPRDGLQNEPQPISTAQKVELVRRLIAANPDEIEVSSFVSPKWIPQLGDAQAVFEQLATEKPGAMVFSALVPNERGLDAALRVNADALAAHGVQRLIDRVAVFTAASETFAQRNTNASITETLERFRPVLAGARAAGLGVRGYVSCAFACPFEGPISPAQVAAVAHALVELGVDELDLADTIGVATPETTAALLDHLLPDVPRNVRCTLHFHDTHGTAVRCVLHALQLGVRSFDAAVGGLGGCPYASTPGCRAPGNLATEALLSALHAAGFRARPDQPQVHSASIFARSLRT